MSEDSENKLLYIKLGETYEQAVERWWKENGLDHEAARRNRKATYERQKREADANATKCQDGIQLSLGLRPCSKGSE